MRVAKTPTAKPGRHSTSQQERGKAEIEVVKPGNKPSLKYKPAERQIAQKKILELIVSDHFEPNRAYDFAKLGADIPKIGMLYIRAARRIFDEIIGGEYNGNDFIEYCRRASDEYELLKEFEQAEKKDKAEDLQEQKEPIKRKYRKTSERPRPDLPSNASANRKSEQTNLRVSPELHEAIKARAKQLGMTKTEFMRRAIEAPLGDPAPR